jgi:hypothetical protein
MSKRIYIFKATGPYEGGLGVACALSEAQAISMIKSEGFSDYFELVNLWPAHDDILVGVMAVDWAG